jgi:hypothetical protein
MDLSRIVIVMLIYYRHKPIYFIFQKCILLFIIDIKIPPPSNQFDIITNEIYRMNILANYLSRINLNIFC